jgi:transcriptional regulator with XRE-family HTH domain
MLGDTIRLFRLERELSPEQLAEAVGISPMAIHYYEENKWRPGKDVMVRLASAFNVSLTELIEGCSILYNENGEILLVRNIGGNHIKVLGRVTEKLRPIYEKEVDEQCGNK